MNEIKAIIFDFDGVLVESLGIKTQAFIDIFKEYGTNIIDKVVEHHLSNGGVSRFEKIKHYYHDFLNEKISEQKIKEIADVFSNLVFDKVVHCNYVEGALEFLQNNHNKYLFFISSGTPEKELLKITNERKIDHFFENIYGSPESKIKHIKKIMRDYNLKPQHIVFVGDATTDRDVAKQMNLFFIARLIPESRISSEKHKINNLTQLGDAIKNL